MSVRTHKCTHTPGSKNLLFFRPETKKLLFFCRPFSNKFFWSIYTRIWICLFFQTYYHLYLYSDSRRTGHPYSESFLDTSKLINKLYPFSLILKDEETSQKFCDELLSKFHLPTPNISASNQIDYQFVSIGQSASASDLKALKFKSFHRSDKLLSVDLVKGTSASAKNDPHFIMNDYHSSQLVDLMLSHASGHDFCIIGPQGKKSF